MTTKTKTKSSTFSGDGKAEALALERRQGFQQKERQRKTFIFTFMAPGVLFYTVFLALPCLLGLFLSFFYWKGLSMNITFAGLENFKMLFQDEVFYKALYNHMLIFVFNTVFVFVLALSSAILLAKGTLREKNAYRVLFFFPSAIPMAIISVMWMSVYNPTAGIMNGILDIFGLPAQGWLADQAMVKGSIIAVMVWKSFGWYMVLFMAAVLNIPTSLYEAAKIDGCGEFKQTFIITIPLIWEVIRTTLVFFVATSCSVGFNVVYMLTKGGPDHASELLTSYMYTQAFKYGKFGYGTAIGVVISVITVVLALTILKVTEREVYEI